LPREEFSVYRDTNNEKILGIAEQTDTNSKMSRVFDKEIREIKQNLLHKANKDDFTKMQAELTKYCAYADLKDLYHKVIPTIEKFEHKIIDIYKEVDQSRQVIARMDEIVSHKANKHTVDDLIEFTRTLASISMV
jgi:hypothetical protein